MQIIIAMGGLGQRFLAKGYRDPKPLITVDGKPMIEHVINLFPGENNFLFVCNNRHLKETKMVQILKKAVPNGKIFGIDYQKNGPVWGISKALSLVDDKKEVIVNYCDFGTYWDYQDFLNHTRSRNADGAVVAYKNFHPHMLGTNNYAFMRDNKQWLLEIKEKEPFTDDRMNEYASNGTYYFKKGNYIKKYFKQLMEERIQVNGEYYVSLIYNLLVRDKLKVSIYEIQHMLQWGTPEDLKEYQQWSDYFKNLVGSGKKKAKTLPSHDPRIYQYWQSFFHKCSWHPYSLYSDPSISSEKVKLYDKKCRHFKQPNR